MIEYQTAFFPKNYHLIALDYGDQCFAFSKAEDPCSIRVEVSSYFSDSKVECIWSQSSIGCIKVPEKVQCSAKRTVKWLLKEGYKPLLREREVRFYRPFGGPSLGTIDPTEVCQEDAIETDELLMDRLYLTVRLNQQLDHAIRKLAEPGEPIKVAFAYLYQAKRQIQEGAIEQALVSFEFALKLCPADSDLRALRGFALILNKRLEEALFIFLELAVEQKAGKIDASPFIFLEDALACKPKDATYYQIAEILCLSPSHLKATHLRAILNLKLEEVRYHYEQVALSEPLLAKQALFSHFNKSDLSTLQHLSEQYPLESRQLLQELGAKYEENKRWDAAEKTYLIAAQIYRDFASEFQLAKVIAKMRPLEGYQEIFDLSFKALMSEKYDDLEKCLEFLDGVDSLCQQLNKLQIQNYLTQRAALRIMKQNREAQEALKLITERYQLAEKTMTRCAVFQVAFFESLTKPSGSLSASTEAALSSSSLSLEKPVAPPSFMGVQKAAKPPGAFGAAEWKRYFGDVGVEPPLPSNIEEILSSPCPFEPDQRVGETHLLVLIPATVDGVPYNLDLLGELVKSPKGEGHPTQYNPFLFTKKFLKQHGKVPAGPSHWIMLKRDVITGTLGKSYERQKALLESKTSSHPLFCRARVPKALELATGVLLEYVKTGIKFYSDCPPTKTRCLEECHTSSAVHNCMVGFSSKGFTFSFTPTNSHRMLGLACSLSIS